jgi:hypothetical protein
LKSSETSFVSRCPCHPVERHLPQLASAKLMP